MLRERWSLISNAPKNSKLRTGWKRGPGMCGPSESAGALLEEFWLDDKPKTWRVTGTEGVEMV